MRRSRWLFYLPFLALLCMLPLAGMDHSHSVLAKEKRPAVKPGIEVLLDDPGVVSGKKVGLITNPTGITSDLIHDVDALLEKGIDLVAVYGPEHGIRGTEEAGSVPGSYEDPKTGLPFYNLYGKKPEEIAPLFDQVDVVLFDIQDVGSRFYTYISTMAYAMEAAALRDKPFVVLDRPNPIGGEKVEGPVLEPDYKSFVGIFPIPVRHGMTVGELAALFNEQFLEQEIGKKADLHVIKMKGWKRDMWFEETGLPWVLPSPNMPTVDTAAVYPGTCLFEGTNLSEGRGTTRPFELLGAPYIKGWELAERMNRLQLPGVVFREAYFSPTFSKYSGKNVGGVQVYVTDRNEYDPIRTALSLIAEVKALYPAEFAWRSDNWIDKLMGTDSVRKAIDSGRQVDEIVADWQEPLDQFKKMREKYYLYH
ncbi:exo-beta-N-acetylmuramidase NamZ family protein [Brevibacillus sp. H7]|uniref:exo-beta-N-acetylmuramidase NamZ family protein n=1 Tax=Brevibacillus sp. H7 TaxID=3349138 RepID=UPI00380273D4